jgi:hypothetical protein
MSAAKETLTVERRRWDGGKQAMSIAAIAGLVGLAATAGLGFSDAKRTLFSYLWAYTYWLTIAFGALGWLCAFWAAKARWMIAQRRVLELLASTLVLLALLFVPIYFGRGHLYPWTHRELETEAAQKIIEHREGYMNMTFWTIRIVLYFFIFVITSETLLRWSTQQDENDLPQNTIKSWKFAPAMMPAMGIGLSFAAFDWLMSLKTEWYSSMFGLYVIAGGVLASMAVWILTTQALKTPLNVNHRHSMGKLLFAFVCFWAYTAFSQFLLIWIADLPEEVPWQVMRLMSGWKAVGVIQIVFHFVLPFIILMSRKRKQSARQLGFMAVWVLVVHAIDIYWIVLPQLNTEGPRPSLSDFTALVGIGGLVVAFAIYRMRGRYLVPVGDPFLPDSLEYRP